MWSEYRNRVIAKKPVVHCITNYVTVNDCANILLGAGASPIMADEIREVEQIVDLADALVINIGTLNQSKVQAMLAAGKKANKRGIPVVLDPVGVGASDYRKEVVQTLLGEIDFTIIRGNMSELNVICDFSQKTRGVDAFAYDSLNQKNMSGQIAKMQQLARRHSCVIAISGAVDLVCDQNDSYLIYNGHETMSRITGTGCMLTALVGAFVSASEDSLKATVASFIMMGLAGEKAYDMMDKTASGFATMRNFLIDGIVSLKDELLDNQAKYLKYRPLDLRLYGITDSNIMKDLNRDTQSSLKGGVTMLQYRQKEAAWSVKLEEAQVLNRICRQHNVPLIINDSLELLESCQATGIHIGQDDGDCREIRSIIGDDKIIGVSCHNVEEAIRAQKQGANYLGIGAMEATSTKNDTIRVSRETLEQILDNVVIPVVVIGGINYGNLSKYPDVNGYALISGIFQSDDIEANCQKIRNRIKEVWNA